MKSVADERRLDEGITTLRALLPFIVNSVAKRQMVPTGDASVLAEAMRPVMESLTQEQVGKLQEVLNPAQVVGLLEVWRLICEEKPKGKK